MKILAVSAHPDDETLGCGGTLLKHVADGDEVSWLITTVPGKDRYDDNFIATRAEVISAVQRAYGFKDVYELEFHAANLDTAPLTEVIDAVAQTVRAARPDRVYVVHPGDVHTDHSVTFEAIWAALKPFVTGNPVEVFCYETASSSDMAPPLSSHQFLANTYSDISAYLDRKLEIFCLYETEVQAPPGPRSLDAISALARSRGAVAGMAYAEAFSAMRVVL